MAAQALRARRFVAEEQAKATDCEWQNRPDSAVIPSVTTVVLVTSADQPDHYQTVVTAGVAVVERRPSRGVTCQLVSRDRAGLPLPNGENGRICVGERRLHFPSTFSTARLIVRTPVVMLGVGTGAYTSECSDGSGAAPSFFDASYFSGDTVPRKYRKIGTPARP